MPIDVCIWRLFVFMSVVETVWGSVGMFVELRPYTIEKLLRKINSFKIQFVRSLDQKENYIFSLGFKE